MYFGRFKSLALGALWTSSEVIARLERNDDDNTCTLYPEGDGKDDSDNIVKAFDQCGDGGKIVFTDDEFSVQKVMNTSGLANTDIELRGKLKWSDDFDYWKKNSYNMWYQNQTTAWILGGENITFTGSSDGEQSGVFDGNGQAWYTQNKGEANQRGRPIAFTVWNSHNFYAEKLKFLQPQFWAVLVTYSQNVTMKDVVVRATTNDLDNASLVNTDGANTWNAKDVTFDGWSVENGDDCIALKGNNTNIQVLNSACHNHSTGYAIGSIGQYAERADNLDGILFDNCEVFDTHAVVYIKSWPGVYQADSSNGNGGGAGPGHVRNMTVRNMRAHNVELPFSIQPCVYIQGDNDDDCEKCKIKVDGVTYQNISGISQSNVVTNFRCPSQNHCDNIHMKDINVVTHNVSVGKHNWGVDHDDPIFNCAYIDNQNTTMGGYCNRWAHIKWKAGNAP